MQSSSADGSRSRADRTPLAGADSGVGNRRGDGTAEHIRDLPHLDHQLVELIGIERLLAIAKGAIGIGMNFDDQAISAHRNRGARQRRYLVALAGAVAGIDDDGQMAQPLHRRHHD